MRSRLRGLGLGSRARARGAGRAGLNDAVRSWLARRLVAGRGQGLAAKNAKMVARRAHVVLLTVSQRVREEDVGTVVSFSSILLLGFFLGMRHATDPDHVVAVATIVSRERSIRAAAPLGAIWGVGHTVTILLVGGAIIAFGIVIPPRVGLTMEFSVAIMLTLLGVSGLSEATRRARTVLRHSENLGSHEEGHRHPHDVAHEQADARLLRMDNQLGHLGAYRLVRPLVVGVVHGLAGSAAIALLVLATIRDPLWALAYLGVFGVGTVAGMLAITTALALPIVYAARRFDRIHRRLGFAAGLVSLLFGMFLVYRIGFVDGLLTDHPHWTPE